MSTLTRLTAPNAANASSASEQSSRAIRPPGDGAVETSSTGGGGGVSSIGGFSFSLRAMAVHTSVTYGITSGRLPSSSLK